MSQLLGSDGHLQRPIRKFQKNSTDVRNVDFSKADDMGLDTLQGDGEADGVDEAEPEQNSNLQIDDMGSPLDQKEAKSTTSQHRGGQPKPADSTKKPGCGINFIQNSSAKMRLPPAAPAKTPHERVKVNQAIQDMLGSAQSQGQRGPQSHSSSFITDRKQPLKDSKDGNTSNVQIAADEEGDDQSVTVTTFHNGAALVDGAFKEEEDEAALSQSMNLNRVLNQTSKQVSLKSSQGVAEKAEETAEKEGTPLNQNPNQ